MVQNKKRCDLYYRQYDFSNKLCLESLSDYKSSSITHLNESIDKTFQDAISECFTEFSSITSLIITREVINSLVHLYISYVPEYYQLMQKLFGFDKKVVMKKNDHLKNTRYYDRLLFYHYLSQSRIRFNQLFTYWSIINTCSIYGKGECKRH